jgi:carboxyl-terminal processing protease
MYRLCVCGLLLLTASTALAGEPVPLKHPVPNARQAFDQVSALIRDNYVDQEIDEEELWSYALAGLVEGLMKSGDKPINEILDKTRLELLQSHSKGQISGIGIVFENVEKMAIVREVLPGGPASNTRMRPNDRIIAVDGKDVADLDMGSIVMMIRGKSGTPVELLMQRGTEEWTETITRGQVQVESVQGTVHEGVGYLRLMHFNEDTPKRLDRVMADLRKSGAKSLIVDLRGSPGGLFDVSLEVAERFLTSGETIVSLKKRDGREEIHRAKRPDAFAGPIVVLIGKETASSAEILAAALKENGRATLVGEKTYGKGTVEKIFELDNGYALKLTVARFYSPKGNNWQGKGIEPDFAIKSEEEQKTHYSSQLSFDPAKDAQLKAALAVLKLGR